MIDKKINSLVSSDTIAAIATACGYGGIGIIRISGSLSLPIAYALFQPSSSHFERFVPWRLHHGRIVKKDKNGSLTVLDEALVVYMPGPRSFTGEDVVEFHCHGGPAILEAVMRALFDKGARQATHGEFTRRAFMNGRMDLTQAEAVAELISAQSLEGVRLAQSKLSGLLGRRVCELRSRVDELRVRLVTAVDFPDEEVDILPEFELIASLDAIVLAIKALLSSYARNRIWRDGAVIVLAGSVNAGKSSLMNALLGRERALVSNIPGTTRDFLEEGIMLDGLPARIIDTAGLRETTDVLEAAGLQAGMEKANSADLVLLVVDASTENGKQLLSCKSFEALSVCLESLGQSCVSQWCVQGRVLGVANKIDLLPEQTLIDKHECCMDWIPVSARTGEGLEFLTTMLREKLLGISPTREDEAAPNLRQSRTLERACLELEAMIDDVRQGIPYDLLGVRLELAAGILDEITGTATSKEILDDIFSSFCIGK